MAEATPSSRESVFAGLSGTPVPGVEPQSPGESGFSETDPNDPLVADLLETEPTEEASSPEPTPDEAFEPKAREPAEETPEPSEEGTEETPEEEAQRLYAGRYATTEQLEQGYHEMQRLQTRTAQERQQLEEYNQRLEAAIREAIPLLQQQQVAQVQPQQAARVVAPGDPEWNSDDPAMVKAYVDAQIGLGVQQQVQQALTPLQAQQQQFMQQQMAQQQQVQQQQLASSQLKEAEQYIKEFLAETPEVVPGSPLEAAIVTNMQEFNLQPTKPSLRLALDATRSERLRQEIMAEDMRVSAIEQVTPRNQHVPSLFDADQGIAVLYQRAGLAPPGTQQTPKVARNPQQAAAVRRAATVETGGTGAPVMQAPGALPRDEMDEAIDALESNRAKSVFGI